MTSAAPAGSAMGGRGPQTSPFPVGAAAPSHRSAPMHGGRTKPTADSPHASFDDQLEQSLAGARAGERRPTGSGEGGPAPSAPDETDPKRAAAATDSPHPQSVDAAADQQPTPPPAEPEESSATPAESGEHPVDAVSANDEAIARTGLTAEAAAPQPLPRTGARGGSHTEGAQPTDEAGAFSPAAGDAGGASAPSSDHAAFSESAEQTSTAPAETAVPHRPASAANVGAAAVDATPAAEEGTNASAAAFLDDSPEAQDDTPHERSPSRTPDSQSQSDPRVHPAGADAHATAHIETRPVPAPGGAAHASTPLAEAGGTSGPLTPAPGGVPDADTPDRIVQSLRLQFQRGGGDAIVHIKPDHLGPLSISLRVENGTVSAFVTADNPLTAEWILANEHTLRDSLRSNGLHLDRLIINRDPDPSGRPPQRDDASARHRNRRRFDDRRSTFEITV